ncbi:hypothetical protein [Kitasatospora sp. NPDC051164]
MTAPDAQTWHDEIDRRLAVYRDLRDQAAADQAASAHESASEDE